MVVGESSTSESEDNNFYGVLDEVISMAYPMGPHVLQLKYRWVNMDKNRNHRTHMELGYKSINTSHFWFPEEPIILSIQAYQVFYIDDPKNGTNWKVVQVIQNKRIWDILKVDDVEDKQLNVPEIVVGHYVVDHIEDDTLGKVDVDPIMELNTISSTSSVGDTSDAFQPTAHTPRRLTLEYIELVKGGLQKEFRGRNHRHFKKFDDPEQARAN
ncbi:acidic leucine-rich nuclear phosphoprotein 32 family member A-like [Cucumis melo var. makuwa]|uniref:Acidic leucine-rich nuclear phosphoprotein 32 family member A-like n=1 Tax=Cucumis melo var. makuwa TaxID=1194695 RepID=A0A5A7V198_CUCMM|nr:acidic leucine-rich nuclear phosphoprotein 32 family member A-like [Cucumis melo var. makuwa]